MLEVRNLTKHYDNLIAVDNVSFTLKPGDVFGFIGSNGAGKTTTIRMLATLLEPTHGTATLNGFDVLRQPMEVRKLIGYMPDFFGLYDDVRVWEYLDFFATLYQIPQSERDAVITGVLELVDLSTKREAFVQTLSRGMQQRLCLAKCLVHDPAMLLLDEPASGLDPRARAELKELITELGRMGKIVIVSSHILPELAGFCNMVGIIERGKMLAFGEVNAVVRAVQPARILEIHLLSAVGPAQWLLESDPNVKGIDKLDETRLAVQFAGDHEMQAELLANLVSKGHKVIELRERQSNLEDVFLKITTGAVN